MQASFFVQVPVELLFEYADEITMELGDQICKAISCRIVPKKLTSWHGFLAVAVPKVPGMPQSSIMQLQRWKSKREWSWHCSHLWTLTSACSGLGVEWVRAFWMFLVDMPQVTQLWCCDSVWWLCELCGIVFILVSKPLIVRDYETMLQIL